MRLSDPNIIAYLIHPCKALLPHHHTNAPNPPTHKHADLKLIKLLKTKQVQISFMFVHVYVMSAPIIRNGKTVGC